MKRDTHSIREGYSWVPSAPVTDMQFSHSSASEFDEWLTEHDNQVRVDYEARRKVDPIVIENIDGEPADAMLTGYGRQLLGRIDELVQHMRDMAESLDESVTHEQVHEQLQAGIEAARAPISSQLDGATERGPIDSWPSGAGQFAARFNALSPEKREERVAIIVENAQIATQVVEGGYVKWSHILDAWNRTTRDVRS